MNFGSNLKKFDTLHDSAGDDFKIDRFPVSRYPPEPVPTEITYVETVCKCHRCVVD